MMITTDRVYVDRSGRKVGPLEHTQKRAGFPWFVRLEGKSVRTFTATGCYHSDGRESEYDLVGEYVDDTPESRKDYSHDKLEDLRRGVERIWDSYKMNV